MATDHEGTLSDPTDWIAIEQVSRAEADRELRISREAGATRYFRPVKQLNDVPATMPGAWEGP
jgi:hypothetical protein